MSGESVHHSFLEKISPNVSNVARGHSFVVFARKIGTDVLFHIFICLHKGPGEGSHSYFGKQTRREGLDDGGGDLPVPHTRLHHNTPMACPSLLRSDRRRVSLTHFVLSLSVYHQWVNYWRGWNSSQIRFMRISSFWNNHVSFPSTVFRLPASLDWMKSKVVAN